MSDTWSNIQAHKKQLHSLRERLQRRRKDPAQHSSGRHKAAVRPNTTTLSSILTHFEGIIDFIKFNKGRRMSWYVPKAHVSRSCSVYKISKKNNEQNVHTLKFISFIYRCCALVFKYLYLKFNLKKTLWSQLIFSNFRSLFLSPFRWKWQHRRFHSQERQPSTVNSVHISGGDGEAPWSRAGEEAAGIPVWPESFSACRFSHHHQRTHHGESLISVSNSLTSPTDRRVTSLINMNVEKKSVVL